MIEKINSFFAGPKLLSGAGARTYRKHLAYAVFQALAEGVLANAPVMALKGMASPSWQMALEKSISSFGMFLLVYLGGVMAVRRKMPFVFWPGMIYAVCALFMGVTDNVMLFLILSGVGVLFDNILRPALTAVIRFNYPVEVRGAVTGEIRKWSSLVFLAGSLISAGLLDLVADNPRMMIKGQMIAAALLLAAGFTIFKTIRVKEDAKEYAGRKPAGLKKCFWDCVGILSKDRRFRRYLGIGVLYAFGGMTFASFIPVLLTKDLEFSYTGATLFLYFIPALITFVTTGYIGRWIDKVSTWRAWAWIRLGWGLDALVLAGAPLAAAWFPPAALVMPFIARFFRGVVQGGSYILWWEVAVNHFAPPGGDTTRYMGMIMFMNGIGRLFGPLLGALLVTKSGAGAVMLAGAFFVLLSSLLCFIENGREKRIERLKTMTNYELSFDRPPVRKSP